MLLYNYRRCRLTMSNAYICPPLSRIPAYIFAYVYIYFSIVLYMSVVTHYLDQFEVASAMLMSLFTPVSQLPPS